MVDLIHPDRVPMHMRARDTSRAFCLAAQLGHRQALPPSHPQSYAAIRALLISAGVQ